MPSFPPAAPPLVSTPACSSDSSQTTDLPASGNIPAWLPPALSAFAFRDYRLQWIGAFVSSIGSWVQQVAQAWLVLDLTSSPFYLGLDAFLGTAPMLSFSLVGGAVADRFDRRKLLLLSQVVQMSSALTLALLVGLHVITSMPLVYTILALSFLTGTAQALSGPAYLALLPNLVPRRFVAQAIAGNSIQFNLARVIGPVVAGLVMARSGAATCFALNVLSFLAVIAALATIRPPQQMPVAPSFSWWQEILTGMRYVFRDNTRRRLCFLATLTTSMGIAVPTLLPQYTKVVWQGDEVLFSHLAACSGLGAVVGAILVAAMAKKVQSLPLILATQAALGLSMMLLAATSWFWLDCLWLCMSGVLLVATYALVTTCFQQVVADDMRGRAVSIYMVCFRGGMAIGGLLAGSLAQWWKVTAAFGLSGLGLVLVSTWASLNWRVTVPHPLGRDGE
ncbi:MAG: MFS transporter [Acidobacteriota bacterium]